MLARTPTTLVYLSAADLGITERERAGLIEVRDDLASGKIKHAPQARFISEGHSSNSSFNMRIWNSPTDCGTCHCIGGEMAARGSLIEDDDDYYGKLDALFYPSDAGSWDALTPAQAVRAIDEFLGGAGADCWPNALAQD